MLAGIGDLLPIADPRIRVLLRSSRRVVDKSVYRSGLAVERHVPPEETARLEVAWGDKVDTGFFVPTNVESSSSSATSTVSARHGGRSGR